MNRLFVVLLLCLVSTALFIETEAKRPKKRDRCPQGERALKAKCGRRGDEQCPGSSYCFTASSKRKGTCCCNDTAATCPDCTAPVQCLVDPCDVTTCPAFPEAKCRSDFCGGCNAHFFIRKREVTAKCQQIKPCFRQGGKDLGINCGRGTTGKCPGSSYCDIHPTDVFATCCCNDTAATCPDCTAPVQCLVDPCDVTTCLAYPNAKCRSDYCGGCNARFFVRRREVTAECEPQE